MPDVQCFAILVERQTSVPVYGPIWERALIQAKWRAAGVPPEKVTTKRVEPGNPYVGNLSRFRFGSIDEEAARLSAKYATNPATGGPLFEIVFPGDTLSRVIEAEMARENAGSKSTMENEAPLPSDEDVPEHLRLENLKGVKAERATVLRQMGITSIDVLASKRPSEIEPAHGIGMTTAQRLISAAIAYLAKHDILPGVAPGEGSLSAPAEPAETPLAAEEAAAVTAVPTGDALDAEGNDILDDEDLV